MLHHICLYASVCWSIDRLVSWSIGWSVDLLPVLTTTTTLNSQKLDAFFYFDFRSFSMLLSGHCCCCFFHTFSCVLSPCYVVHKMYMYVSFVYEIIHSDNPYDKIYSRK